MSTRTSVDHFVNVAGEFGNAVERRFGQRIQAPEIVADNAPGLQPEYAGVQPYGQEGVMVVPTSSNMDELYKRRGSAAFGLMVDDHIRPAVVTRRSTPGQLDLAYLAPRDRSLVGTEYDSIINPKSPVIDPSWAVFLTQAGTVQDRKVGADHDSAAPQASELGHIVMGQVGLLKPELLKIKEEGGGIWHPVHKWTESVGGIAEAASGSGVYDYKTSSGLVVQLEERAYRDPSGESTPPFLLQVPGLDESMRSVQRSVRVEDLAAGAGLVTVQSQLEISPTELQKRQLDNMARL